MSMKKIDAAALARLSRLCFDEAELRVLDAELCELEAFAARLEKYNSATVVSPCELSPLREDVCCAETDENVGKTSKERSEKGNACSGDACSGDACSGDICSGSDAHPLAYTDGGYVRVPLGMVGEVTDES